MKTYQQFIFEDYSFDLAQKRVELQYSLDGEVHFTESYDLLFDAPSDYNAEALDRALQALWLMAGVSYYKATLPEEMVINKVTIAPEQAAFLAKTYRYGLGEFFYQNKLPMRQIVFPATGQASEAPLLENLNGSLVPIGGGKDSTVTAELLGAMGQDVTSWRVGQHEAMQPLIDRLGTSHLKVSRTVSPELMKLNQDGAYNGHVQITAILSALAVVCAVLTGKKQVVFSNEWSAGEGNMEYEGEQINHQYSKSIEFEKEFQAYLKQFVSPSLEYFSLLRPFSELKVAELFCNRYLEKYWGTFSSCNRNFHLGTDNAFGWCGECPKCAFVFLLFAPFVAKSRLIELFNGRNLFESESLRETYQELLGLSGHKPFECVGEIQECRQAALMARATGNYPELDTWKFDDPGFDYKQWQPDSMPDSVREALKQATSDK